MSLFHPYSRHYHQRFGPLVSQSYHPFGPSFHPAIVSDLHNTVSQLSRWADQTHQQLLSSAPNRSLSTPRFHVEDNDSTYVLEGNLQGLNQDDVHIDFINDTTLTVQGYSETVRHDGFNPSNIVNGSDQTIATSHTTPSITTSNTATLVPEANQDTPVTQTPSSARQPRHRITHRSVSHFKRTFTLPHGIDKDNVSINFQDGKLRITVPKPDNHIADRDSGDVAPSVHRDENLVGNNISLQGVVAGDVTESGTSDGTKGSDGEVSEDGSVISKGKGRQVTVETVDEEES